MNILLKDVALPQTVPFSRLRTIFSFRDGIYTPIERVKRLYGEGCNIYFTHPDEEYTKLVAPVDGLIPYYGDADSSEFQEIISSERVDTLTILDRVEQNIIDDLALLDKSNFYNGEEVLSAFPNIEIIGNVNNIFIAKDVKIVSRNTILNASDGIIVIDSGVVINPFTTISGTIYIGKGSEIVNARISHNTLIGYNCRVCGEVSSAIMNDYSYKSHDGFLGRSILGLWVNLGALTTTSNLKNNYSDVSLMLPETLSIRSGLVRVSTKNIKYGSLIGDFTKTAIGTMINCGSVVDTGCNILSQRLYNYSPPLRWLDNETEYDVDRFVRDCKLIVERKGATLHPNFEKLVRFLLD